MAGGGVIGGVLLDLSGGDSFSWSVLGLMLPVLAAVALARRHAFPFDELVDEFGL